MHQRETKKNEEKTWQTEHEEKSKSGVRVAQSVLPRIDDAKKIESVIDTFSKDSVSKSLAARASQTTQQMRL